MAVACEASTFAAINPEGLSAAELICVPVDNRVKVVLCKLWAFAKLVRPRKESTFVAILVLMPLNLS